MSGEGFRRLTMADRRRIEDGLRSGMRVASIARDLGKDWATVSREVKKHRTRHTDKYTHSECRNLCLHRDTCRKVGICRLDCGGMKCAKCATGVCNEVCPDFTHVGMCPKLEKAPYVCNACRDRMSLLCRYETVFYDADCADEASKISAVRARTGVDCSEEDLVEMVRVVKPLLRQGQSLRHIWNTHEGEFPVSMRTFYRYIDLGVLDICNLDLPKKVSYKPRKKRPKDYVPFRPNLKGRLYEDFLELDEQVRFSAVEMDCVCGKRHDRQAILTLLFRRTRFQIMLMLPEHTGACVAEALDLIETLCGPYDFARLFGTILTDRGAEFMDFEAIERSAGGGKRCKVFYCDPLQSHQKGSCEKNHVLIRNIIPKGVSLDDITNYELSVICSHVNSYTRDSLGGVSPFDLSERLLPKDLLEGLAITRIDPEDVVMKPTLLGNLLKKDGQGS